MKYEFDISMASLFVLKKRIHLKNTNKVTFIWLVQTTTTSFNINFCKISLILHTIVTKWPCDGVVTDVTEWFTVTGWYGQCVYLYDMLVLNFIQLGEGNIKLRDLMENICDALKKKEHHISDRESRIHTSLCISMWRDVTGCGAWMISSTSSKRYQRKSSLGGQKNLLAPTRCIHFTRACVSSVSMMIPG